jgi:lysozyme family protein
MPKNKNKTKDPIDIVLEHEGGFVNNPNDRGGPTNRGVTIKTYSEWLGRSATIDELRSLTYDEARDIYERLYLFGPRIDRIQEPLRTPLLDMSVNHGPKNAIKMLQRVLNALGFGPLDIDGTLGPQSVDAAKRAIAKDARLVRNALVDERLAFYNRLVARDRTQEQFLRGWTRRAESFRV